MTLPLIAGVAVAAVVVGAGMYQSVQKPTPPQETLPAQYETATSTSAGVKVDAAANVGTGQTQGKLKVLGSTTPPTQPQPKPKPWWKFWIW